MIHHAHHHFGYHALASETAARLSHFVLHADLHTLMDFALSHGIHLPHLFLAT